jgi:hypothetical protein
MIEWILGFGLSGLVVAIIAYRMGYNEGRDAERFRLGQIYEQLLQAYKDEHK